MTSGHKAESLYRNLDETRTPYAATPVQITAAATWEGVTLFEFELPPAYELAEFTAPSLNFTTLVFHVAGPVTLTRKFEGPPKRARSGPGGLNIHPAQTPGAYAWDDVGTIAFLMPSVAFMTRLAADLTRQNPDTIGLRDDFNFQDGLLKHLCLALLGEAHSGGLHGRVYAESLAHTLVLHLLSNYSTAAGFRSLPDKALNRQEVRWAKEFIRAHLHQNVSVAELAASAQLSSSHFIRRFKLATGLAPHQYLNQSRVERAKELLGSADLTIAEVAQEVGFFDHSHLIRHFKYWVGVTPKTYRDSKLRN